MFNSIKKYKKKISLILDGVQELKSSVHVLSNQIEDLNIEMEGKERKSFQYLDQQNRGMKLVNRLGFNLVLDASSLVDREVYLKNEWEPRQTEFFKRAFQSYSSEEDFIFLDIGAYWGLYSLLAHKSGVKQIICFEPDRTNYSQLLAQQFLNGLSGRFPSHNLAVSSCSKEVIFIDSRTHPDGNRAGVGITENSSDETYSVQAVAIDDFLQIHGKLVFVKVDVEGHEAKVLRGMKDTISRCDVFLQVECYPQHELEISTACSELGLTKVHQIDVDAYYTNIKDDDLNRVMSFFDVHS